MKILSKKDILEIRKEDMIIKKNLLKKEIKELNEEILKIKKEIKELEWLKF